MCGGKDLKIAIRENGFSTTTELLDLRRLPEFLANSKMNVVSHPHYLQTPCGFLLVPQFKMTLNGRHNCITTIQAKSRDALV
jgi:hypothetical protein